MQSIAIISITVAIIGLILIVLVIQYNKYQILNIKIDKGESSLSSALAKKHAILLRYIEILKNTITINEEELDEYHLLNLKSSPNKINNKLNEMHNIINKYLDNNENLLKENTVININNELQDINISINAIQKYYNNNIEKYNILVHKFPSNIISKIFRYKDKEYISNVLSDNLKILANEEN